MPVTDSPGEDDDWLQQFMAGHQAAQAFGASQPFGPGGLPGPYSGGPQGLMPGGGLYGRTQTTPGAPSMGYPALGQPGAPRPQSAPDPNASALGFSLTSNPITRALNYFNPVSSAKAAETGVHPLGPHAVNGPPFPVSNSPLGPAPGPAAPATADPAPSGPAPIGNYNDLVKGPMWPTPPVPTGPVSGANPANRGVGTTRTPGAGAPAGNPSQTPQPANSTRPPNSSRFVQVDRPNMDVAGGGMGRGGPPQMTALNLAGLFGGRGQQAANPANVPAANAQTVNGALAPGGMSNAPWGMGPLQPGMNWPGAMGPFTQDQLAARGLKQRYG